MLDNPSSVPDEDLLNLHDELVTFRQDNSTLVGGEDDFAIVLDVVEDLLRLRELL
jgi:hypothetical protein